MEVLLFSLSKKSENRIVGGGAYDAPAVKPFDFIELSADSKHFQTGRRGHRPLQKGFSTVWNVGNGHTRSLHLCYQLLNLPFTQTTPATRFPCGSG